MENNDSSMQQNAVDTKALTDRAQRYCAAAEHCPADVEQLLKRLGASDEQTDEVIGILRQQNYLNEARYCRAFVHDKVAFQGWGRMKIQAGLRAKHLPDKEISEALSEADEEAYAANIRKLLHAKRGQDRQKVMRFMLQRGYTFDDLRLYVEE
jgi:regulatory protein